MTTRPAALVLPTNAFVVVLIAPFGAIGAVLASRRPEHRIGWIFCSFAVTFAVYWLATAYATTGLAAVPEWPAERFAAWLGVWLWVDTFAARLRDQIGLGALQGQLLEAMHDTMQPAPASVWLREPAR